TDAEIILRSPDAHPTEGISVFLYSDYEGSDIIIKDRDEAVYTYFVASGGTYTFSELKVRVIADKNLVSGLIKDFDMSLQLLKEMSE
ncbi:MAG: hypothetical protein U9N35_02290, partial [Euryarchaeota archaeon]|nr:hypothetical protein [Euryarchaeota archaeon]